MTKPTIHDNGTSRAELQAGYGNAYAALELAYEAIKRTEPKPGDYKLQEAAYRLATIEHIARLKSLNHVMAEIWELIGHCGSV